jgi:hypothetical protein
VRVDDAKRVACAVLSLPSITGFSQNEQNKEKKKNGGRAGTPEAATLAVGERERGACGACVDASCVSARM